MSSVSRPNYLTLVVVRLKCLDATEETYGVQKIFSIFQKISHNILFINVNNNVKFKCNKYYIL